MKNRIFANNQSIVRSTLFSIVFVFFLPTIGFGQQMSFLPGSNEGLPQISFSNNLVIGASSDSPIIGGISSVAVNNEGHIFVSETRIPCIYKFDSSGKLLAQFGQKGDGPGDLSIGTRIAIDSSNRIIVAGMSGDVQIMDSDWNYVGGFQRENPGNMVRSILTSPSGSVLIATLGLMDKTTVDEYSADLKYTRSFASTFAGEDEDWRYESAYAGGYIFSASDGSLLFAQLSPYEIRRYSNDKNLISKTNEGGIDFVPEPPRPDFSAERVSIRFPYGTTGIVSLKDGTVLTSSWRTSDNDLTQSLFCLYNKDLELIGRSIYKDFHSIKGIDKEGQVFLFSRDDSSIRISRAQIILKN